MGRPRLADDICRWLPAGARAELWLASQGEIPRGMRIGWTCDVPYCGNPEHMVLAENKNANRNNWDEFAERIQNLCIGESVDFPNYPNLSENLSRLNSAMSMRIPLVRISARALPGGFHGVRVYRTGTWPGIKNGFDSVVPIKKLPLLMTNSIGVYLDCLECGRKFLVNPCASDVRKYCSWGCAGRAKLNPMLHNALEPSAFFLGFLWGTNKPTRTPKKCEMRGCVFPAQKCKTKCHRHEHFFDYNMSMEGRALSFGDIFPNEDNKQQPLLSSFRGFEIEKSHENTKFVNNGYEDKRWKDADAFLLDSASKAETEAERAGILSLVSGLSLWAERNAPSQQIQHGKKAFARVFQEPTIDYVPETATVNYQGRGTRGGHPGGHKKIRKKQRQRPAGWHGSRPKHDVFKRWDRDTIEVQYDYDDFEQGQVETIGGVEWEE